MPQALDDVCARALQRDPNDRFDTAADFAEALEEAAEPLGIATPKQVAAYVRDTAGELVDATMARVRAFQEGARISNVSGLPRLELGDNPDSSVHPFGYREASPSAPPWGATPAASGPSAQEMLPSSEVTRSRRPLVVGVAAAALVLVGAVIATVTLVVVSQHDAAPHQGRASTTTATSTTTPAIATTATSEVESVPGISVTDLPRAQNNAPPRHVRHGVPMPVPPPPVVSATATATVTAKPVTAPTASAFNPESM